MSTQTQYNRLSQWLHWLVASLIILQYILMELAEMAEHADLTVKQLSIVANHKSIGITVLLLAIFRLLWRFKHPAPSLPSAMPGWQKRVSKIMHVLLYGMLFALPISGWLMSSANAYTVSYFNLFPLPDLIGPDKATANLLKDIHEWLGEGLVVLAVLHIGAALKHHWLDKDDVLTRMLNRNSLIVSTVLLVGGVLFWGAVMKPNRAASPEPEQVLTVADAKQAEKTKVSNLPAWQIDYDNSHIKFTGEQAGADFTGEWTAWQAELKFDESQLGNAVFDVSIDVSNVNTDDSERDETIRSDEFFNASKFPKAKFIAEDFSRDGEQFVAKGELTMKGIRHPVDFIFSVTRSGDKVVLEGTAELVRHQWNIGTGDWADPTWVGSQVDVAVRVEATVP